MEMIKKEAFIKEYLRSKVIIETSLYAIFKKVKPFERELDKYVSEFTKDEILEMLKTFKSKSANSLLNHVVVLKHYSRWMTGVIGKNAYEDICKADVMDLVDSDASTILTREDVNEIEYQLLNWSDKAIIELLFNGVSGKSMIDLYSVSEECVQGNMLIVNGKEFPMTDRLEFLLPKAFNEIELMTYGNTMKIIPVNGKGRIYKERANSLGVPSQDAVFRYFYRKIQIFRDYLGIKIITPKDLQSAGLWHYLQAGMRETGLSMRDFLKTKQGEALGKQYGFSEYYIDNIINKYSQYE